MAWIRNWGFGKWRLQTFKRARITTVSIYSVRVTVSENTSINFPLPLHRPLGSITLIKLANWIANSRNILTETSCSIVDDVLLWLFIAIANFTHQSKCLFFSDNFWKFHCYFAYFKVVYSSSVSSYINFFFVFNFGLQGIKGRDIQTRYSTHRVRFIRCRRK